MSKAAQAAADLYDLAIIKIDGTSAFNLQHRNVAFRAMQEVAPLTATALGQFYQRTSEKLIQVGDHLQSVFVNTGGNRETPAHPRVLALAWTCPSAAWRRGYETHSNTTSATRCATITDSGLTWMTSLSRSRRSWSTIPCTMRQRSSRNQATRSTGENSRYMPRSPLDGSRTLCSWRPRRPVGRSLTGPTGGQRTESSFSAPTSSNPAHRLPNPPPGLDWFRSLPR